MTSLQQRARALGDPTRHAVFQHLAARGTTVGVAELTEHFGLNHNAIRQHLAKLVAAGLVVETKATASGPGRPRLVYTVDPGAEGPWGTAGPYERLSGLLVEVITSGRTPREVGRHAAGRLRTPSPSGDVLADMATAMARQGFDPEILPGRSGSDIVLRRCPFETAARADRETICSLHLGIAEGVAQGRGVAVVELVARDPRKAGCRLRLRATEEGVEPPPEDAKLALTGRTTKP